MTVITMPQAGKTISMMKIDQKKGVGLCLSSLLRCQNVLFYQLKKKRFFLFMDKLWHCIPQFGKTAEAYFNEAIFLG